MSIKIPFFVDTRHNKSIRVIQFLKSPKGRTSRFYNSVRVSIKGDINTTMRKAVAMCDEGTKMVYFSKLNQGYTVGEILKYPTMEPVNIYGLC